MTKPAPGKSPGPGSSSGPGSRSRPSPGSGSRPGSGSEPPAAARAAHARLASSLLLVRDGAQGLELFLLARHPATAFAPGALVYPGGAVDESDRNPALRQRAQGVEEIDDEGLALRIAAIREAFEEGGVLLARPRRSGADAGMAASPEPGAGGTATPPATPPGAGPDTAGSPDPDAAGGLLGGERVEAIRRRFASRLAGHSLDMAELAEAENLVFACDRLVPFAHWITPESQPRRFDTHFFLAAAPAGQTARHDGHESVDSLWLAPHALVEGANAGKWYVMFPTRMNAEKAGRSRTAASALAAARATPVVTVMPKGRKVEGGRLLRIPAEAGYGVTEVLVDARGAVTPLR